MKNKLVITDFHFTCNPLDFYRWEVFTTLRNYIKDYNIHTLIILGDICEDKDNHSYRLPNTFIKELESLGRYLEEIIILCGNHDYIDQNVPYFKFLDLKILYPIYNKTLVRFITKPTMIKDDLFVPYAYANFEEVSNSYKSCDTLYLHHSFEGVLSRYDYKLHGLSETSLDNIKFNRCYSGHIHLAQSYGKVEFIGAPYAIKYGDNNCGRCLIINQDKYMYMPIKATIQKHDVKINNIEALKEYDIKENDQVKVVFDLSLSNCFEYEEIKKYINDYIKAKKAILTSVKGNLITDVVISVDKAVVKQNIMISDEDRIKQLCVDKNLNVNYSNFAIELMKG